MTKIAMPVVYDKGSSALVPVAFLRLQGFRGAGLQGCRGLGIEGFRGYRAMGL